MICYEALIAAVALFIQGCERACSAERRLAGSLTRRPRMKSFAPSDTKCHAGCSKLRRPYKVSRAVSLCDS